MISELVVVVLTLWKGFSHWRENRSPLVKALFEDGLSYFLYLFAISLANAIVLIAAPIDYANLLLELQRVLHAMLTARVLLHIRNAMFYNANPRVETMSFAAAPGNPRLTRSGSGEDSVELGEIQSADMAGSYSSVASRQGKRVNTGALGVHITTGTLADEDLHQIGLDSRIPDWKSKEAV